MEQEKIGETLQPKVKFSWLRIGKIVLIVVIVAALAGGGWFLANARQTKIAWASFIADSHEHYLPCEQLPFLPEVQKALAGHADAVAKIKQLGAVQVEASKVNCPTADGRYYFIKGDVLVGYHSHAQRSAIEKFIGKNFFGLPWRGGRD
jgi:hypothetical protein